MAGLSGVRIVAGFVTALATACALSMSAAAEDGLSQNVGDLVGAPVFAADGQEIGEVAAIAAAGDGTINEIRVTTDSPLGIGARTVVLPPKRYITLQGAIVVDFTAAEFDDLPSTGRAR